MVLRAGGRPPMGGHLGEGPWYQRLRLPLCIAVLGLLWNLAGLGGVFLTDVLGKEVPPALALVAATVLGTLPAVALHSVWQTTEAPMRRRVGLLTVVGYGLSAAAAGMNLVAALIHEPVPAADAWRLLTWGFLLVFALLLVATQRALGGHGGLVVVFLAVCSVAALPLSHHPDDSFPWWLDFLGHHASLPVAVAVLYRDFRFVFVDHFLKRTFSFLLLVALSFGLYVVGVLPWLRLGDGRAVSVAVSGLIISLWVLTALAYPWVHRATTWAFDRLLLRRPDYQELRRRLAERINEGHTTEAVLSDLCQSFQQALRSTRVAWKRVAGIPPLPRLSDGAEAPEKPAPPGRADMTDLVHTADGGLAIVVPTLDAPRCVVTFAPAANGHRFLSEDLMLVEAAALMAARRIDALRTTHERCETALREQEMQKLATEAELRALRAQINPHFLFNALNTIGYLIDTAPERAATTLADLTSLLRGILRRMEGSFTTLGEELELVRSYLDIERARFEARLSVRIDVPDQIKTLQVPALVLQPIVENAVKHGIQPSMEGGHITIVGRVAPDPRHPGQSRGAKVLSLEVRDTGVGATGEQWRRGRRNGIGLSNVERRLRGHYGDDASLRMTSEPGVGTTVQLRLPAQEAVPANIPIASTVGPGER
jgi:two-component system LytT family sensor kinase